jgi:hypothetical protein
MAARINRHVATANSAPIAKQPTASPSNSRGALRTRRLQFLCTGRPLFLKDAHVIAPPRLTVADKTTQLANTRFVREPVQQRNARVLHLAGNPPVKEMLCHPVGQFSTRHVGP